MIYALGFALLLICILGRLLLLAQQDIRDFPTLLSDKLAIQQTSWMAALERKDKDLRDVTEAYLRYQQKVVPIDPDRPLRPPQPSAFRMKPNPPLAKPEKGA